MKDVYTSYYGREISLLTNHVTIQRLKIQFRITFLVVAIKIKMKSLKHFDILRRIGRYR
jgi:hypothetical protein